MSIFAADNNFPSVASHSLTLNTDGHCFLRTIVFAATPLSATRDRQLLRCSFAPSFFHSWHILATNKRPCLSTATKESTRLFVSQDTLSYRLSLFPLNLELRPLPGPWQIKFARKYSSRSCSQHKMSRQEEHAFPQMFNGRLRLKV